MTGPEHYRMAEDYLYDARQAAQDNEDGTRHLEIEYLQRQAAVHAQLAQVAATINVSYPEEPHRVTMGANGEDGDCHPDCPRCTRDDARSIEPVEQVTVDELRSLLARIAGLNQSLAFEVDQVIYRVEHAGVAR